MDMQGKHLVECNLELIVQLGQTHQRFVGLLIILAYEFSSRVESMREGFLKHECCQERIHELRLDCLICVFAASNLA